MNTEEPWNPNADLIVEKGSTYQGCVAAEECRKVSGQEQVDAAAWLVQTQRSMAVAMLELFRVARRKKMRRGKGENGKDPRSYL